MEEQTEQKEQTEQTEEKQVLNPAHQLANRLRRKWVADELVMHRVPLKTVKAFKDLANEEFCGDYGLTLKFLVDGLINADLITTIQRVDELENRVQVIESKQTEEKPEPVNTKKMLDGSVRRTRK